MCTFVLASSDPEISAEKILITTASEGGAILAMAPIVTMVLSTLILKEYPTLRQVASIIVSVIGVIIIIFSKGVSVKLAMSGYLFLFLAIATDSMCTILTRKYLIYSPTERVYMMTLLGAIVFMPMAIIEHVAAGTLREYLILFGAYNANIQKKS